jgi:hypothetical protein
MQRDKGFISIAESEETAPRMSICGVCNQVFSRQDNMRRHMQTIHQGGGGEGSAFVQPAVGGGGVGGGGGGGVAVEQKWVVCLSLLG